MEFFLEMLLTAVVTLLFSFLVAKLASLPMAGNGGGRENDPTSDQAEEHEIGVGADVATEELRFGLKLDARVVQMSERNFRVVDENVEPVDRFGSEADRVVDELEEAAKVEELVVPTSEDESLADLSPENVVVEEMIVRGEASAEETSGEIDAEREKELIVRMAEDESTASASPENVIAEEIMIRGQEEGSESTEGRSVCAENSKSEDVVVAESEERSESTEGRSVCAENAKSGDVVVAESEEGSESTEGRSVCAENAKSGDVVVAESEEVRVEESDTVEESEDKMELNTEGEGENEEKEELSIEEDDDWEGIEKSELEKAFAAAAKFLEESGKAEEIGAEAKMEMYGLHKIATEGPCREAQPMAVMVSARAKWNAWQKLGNMTQEEAMEQYRALVSKEIPGLMNIGHNVMKMSEIETSVVLPPNSGSLEDRTTLDTTGVESSKND